MSGLPFSETSKAEDEHFRKASKWSERRRRILGVVAYELPMAPSMVAESRESGARVAKHQQYGG